jgi:hypothetical protein
MPLRFLSVLLLLAPLVVLNAQQADAPASNQPFIIHVSQNLIQLPTLVLTASKGPHAPVPIAKFNISIDSGPNFHPTHMHIEGDDPITLAILIDAAGSQDKLLKNLPVAFETLRRDHLQPHDHVSIYASDCVLIRSALDAPADSTALDASINLALLAPTLHGTTPRRTCKGISLSDAIVNVTAALGKLPGRRVLLVLSDGDTQPGQFSFAQATQLAVTDAVTVFGMRDMDHYDQSHASITLNHLSLASPTPGAISSEDQLDELCQKSGGLLTTVSPRAVPAALHQLINTLRGRYILEFPRPDQNIPGNHIVDVTINKSNAYIRTSGVTVPPPAAVDPNTLPQQPSPAIFGKQRPPVQPN